MKVENHSAIGYDMETQTQHRVRTSKLLRPVKLGDIVTGRKLGGSIVAEQIENKATI